MSEEKQIQFHLLVELDENDNVKIEQNWNDVSVLQVLLSISIMLRVTARDLNWSTEELIEKLDATLARMDEIDRKEAQDD